MTDFRYAHAASADWQQAVKSCLDQLGEGQGSLGFVYVTDALADHARDVLSALKKATGVPHWVGTVGIGICATAREYLDEPAVAVMVGDFEPGSFSVFSGLSSETDADKVSLKCGATPANFAIVHADPRNAHLTELVTKVAGKVESGFLVGGLTSSRRENFQFADGVVEGGLSGVLFSDAVTIATRLTQGCSPLGPKHAITASQQNVIISLDGRPALDVFREDIGEALGRDLNRIGGHVFAGLPIAGSDTGDYLVRNLVGIDPSNKLIAIGEMVHQNTNMLFCKRDAATAQEDMKRMLESIRQGMFTQPRGGVYYSCIGRGASLFGPDSGELKLIRETLGEFPLVGFFCNGEISHNRLYGYTGVLTLFM
jgi:small ligand-binding sensory domain FIST